MRITSDEIDAALKKDDRYMLRDQMGLIRLLFEELPEVTRQAEAVSNLAFNVRLFCLTIMQSF
jgi:hypothetical protein